LRNTLYKDENKIISNIFSEKYYEVTFFNGIPYVSHLLLELLNKEEILPLLKKTYISADEIISIFNFIPKAKFALEWILSFLYQHKYLNKAEHNGVKQYNYDNTSDIEPNKILMKLLEIDNNIAPSCNLMEYVIKEYPNFLKGYKTGFEIIFSSNKMVLWNDYFSNNNSGYSVYNHLGALGVIKWLPKKNKIKLLELGGGTGSSSEILISKLKERHVISNIEEYIFSDISPVFLRAGNIAIMKNAPQDFQYSLKTIDFNKPLIKQGIKTNDLDIVYGVNTLHVAKNLTRTLREIHNVIKPGGLIIISECVRDNPTDFLVQEIIFNLLDDYSNVEIDPWLRTTPGFLPYIQWLEIFRVSGFINMEIILNTDGLLVKGKPKIYPKLAAVIKGVKG
jgi:SAM-dependent methyltransferase